MSQVIPLIHSEQLLVDPVGRAGDWWEPTSILASDLAELLPVCSTQRLPLDLVATLLIEHELVRRDAALRPDGSLVLDQASVEAPLPGPGSIHGDYLRMLRVGELDYLAEREPALSRRMLFAPLRLHPIIATIDLVALRADDLPSAICFEIAAASQGMFMREWALRTLLLAAH